MHHPNETFLIACQTGVPICPILPGTVAVAVDDVIFIHWRHTTIRTGKPRLANAFLTDLPSIAGWVTDILGDYATEPGAPTIRTRYALELMTAGFSVGASAETHREFLEATVPKFADKIHQALINSKHFKESQEQ